MKLVCLLILSLSTGTFLSAQKIYTARAGRISFFSSAPLEDIDAKNNAVQSQFSTATGQYNFDLNIKDFHFENDLMEEHFNESYLESDKFPKAYFRGFITNFKDINFSKDGIFNATVKGNLTLHGITKEVTQNGNFEIKGGKVTAKSKFNITIKDYNIGGSVVGKMISPTVEVTVNCFYE